MKLSLEKQFSVSNALQCALASRDVYSRADIQTADAHATITQLDNCVLVAFRGTASIRDVLTDADFWLKNISAGAMVHAGFYMAVAGIQDKVQQRLYEMCGNAFAVDVPIFFCGHSLGGALARLSSYRAKCFGLEVAGVYTFGEPRGGNLTFARQCDKALGPIHYRVTNGADIVPWIPWLPTKYHHSGAEEYMPWTGRIFSSVDLPVKLLTNGVEIWREFRRGSDAALADHHEDQYVSNLQRLNS